jgi:hypothetical protein
MSEIANCKKEVDALTAELEAARAQLAGARLAEAETDAAQLRAALVELNDAMHRYEWDVLGANVPPKHRAMMARVDAALSGRGPGGAGEMGAER